MVVAPRGDGVVEVLDRRHLPHEHREDAEQEGADHCDRKRQRQEQPRHRRAVESADEEGAQAGVRTHRLAHGARDFLGGVRGRGWGMGVPPGRNEGRETGRERCEKVGEERHRGGSRNARVSYRVRPVFPVRANGKHCSLRFVAIVALPNRISQ